jgi:hypothetical protein
MHKISISIVITVILLIAMFGFLHAARGQILSGQNGEVILNTQSQDSNTRQITAPEGNQLNQPLISFIDSPTVACVLPDTSKDECFINWYYMSVSADPNYMITMTVALNSLGYVSRYGGFFQTSMYVPYNMTPQGYKVTCGALGSGGVQDWGAAYAWTIRARDSSNLKSANYGTAYCPAFIP